MGKITKQQLSPSLLEYINRNKGGGSISFKKNSVIISETTNKVNIGIEGYNKNADLLMVYKNTVYLEETIMYTVSSDSSCINNPNGNWDANTLFNFIVIKNAGSDNSNNTAQNGNGSTYTHPETHPVSMITGLADVAKSGLYSDLTGIPTKLSEFTNDIGLSNNSSTTITVSNSLDKYPGDTVNDKIVAMFNDINTNHKNTPMEIILPDGNLEITTDLVAKYWNNKVFRCPGNLIFKNCNAIEFKCCRNNDIFINRVSSVEITANNPCGLIGLTEVNNISKNGIKISDCCNNIIKINTICGFNIGFHLYSDIFSAYSGNNYDTLYDCGGTYYNDIYINAIWRCKQGMLLSAGNNTKSPDKSGWVNDNRIFNTFFDCNRAVQIGLKYGSRPLGEPSDAYQNNKFFNFGFEQIRDTKDPVAIDMLQGQSNSFINPRFEKSMTNTGYLFIREGKNATMNRYDTSNYFLNLNRIQLNTSATRDEGTDQGKHHSMVVASFIKEGSGILANKMTAIKEKIIYEGYGINNYYFSSTDNSYSSPNNMINYTFSDTEFAKFRNSKGEIKTLGYTS